MTPQEAAAAIARPVGSIGSRFMFDPATYAAASEHGYEGLDFYVAGRAGVLGDAPAAVVVAALGFFAPAMVEPLWRHGIRVAPAIETARRFAAACGVWGEHHFGGELPYDELAELAGRVIEAAPAAGHPIFAGWRDITVPSSPKSAAAHQLNVLREWRASAHLAALVAAGIAPSDAVLAKGGPPNAELFGYPGPHRDVSHLAAPLDAVEQTTNDIAAVPLAHLAEPDLVRFVGLVRDVRAGLV